MLSTRIFLPILGFSLRSNPEIAVIFLLCLETKNYAHTWQQKNNRKTKSHQHTLNPKACDERVADVAGLSRASLRQGPTEGLPSPPRKTNEHNGSPNQATTSGSCTHSKRPLRLDVNVRITEHSHFKKFVLRSFWPTLNRDDVIWRLYNAWQWKRVSSSIQCSHVKRNKKDFAKMPLILLCGLPCSGKVRIMYTDFWCVSQTRLALQLKEHLEKETSMNVVLINDESLNIKRNEAYKGLSFFLWKTSICIVFLRHFVLYFCLCFSLVLETSIFVLVFASNSECVLCFPSLKSVPQMNQKLCRFVSIDLLGSLLLW